MKTKTGCIVLGMLLMLGGLLYASPPGYHSADYNPRDWKIELGELLRLIQFYNSGGYHVDASGADGYGPGTGSHVGAPHDSDYSPQDWKIGLPELLRLIQFYNSGGYHVEDGTADGYAPRLGTGLSVTSFAINRGAATTMLLDVTLNNTATNGPTEYMASESMSFTGASWQPYATAPAFTLSSGVGTRTVYFKVRNGTGESSVVSDTIFLVPNTLSVGSGTFTMGRTASGDDTTHGGSDELPTHSVTLDAYQIGKYLVTNKDYCDVLNWAQAQGYLKTAAGAAWAGTGDVYAGGNLQFILAFTDSNCNVQYSGGVFSSKTRVGLPGTTNYSMDTHPVEDVSWYGSVAFCNWLSQMEGLTPCYDMTTADWPLTVAPPTAGGYRLPTEAEWERAAAWGGNKHWIYGFTSDTNSSNNQCNDFWYDGSGYDYVNPLGLTTMPYTSPVGWFNGTNVSPNGNVTTGNSVSPVGCYDMSGNVWEWCGDWYGAYGLDAQTDPMGPAAGPYRVLRGGGWGDNYYRCRSAYRTLITPGYTIFEVGFRLAKTVCTLTYTTGPHGTISGVALQTVDSGGSGTAVTAVPDAGYVFLQWSDGSTQNPRTDTNVTGAITETAIFAVIGTPSVAMVSVPWGTFWMGNSGRYDDATYGGSDELPTHSVTLGAYQIGKYLVTNKDYCDVLNWALAQGYLKTAAGAAWAGTGDIYAGGNLQIVLTLLDSSNCNIQYSGGVFTSKMRVGLPGTTHYSMDTHPVEDVTWYGSVAFCNWLSQMDGLTPCYDMTTANWPLTAAPATGGGYRLPTEAEWERAAAWDGSKHWIYGFTSDTLGTATNRCNDYTGSVFVNPLGLTTYPDTSPVGWFNGTNVSPNGSVTTVNSVSPVGAYDMSGNVLEWCGDWYLGTYYSGGSMTNPTGPASGSDRAVRGGNWSHVFGACRSACRNHFPPGITYRYIGFRLAKTVTTQYALTYTPGANGTISGTSPQMVVSGGSGTTVTAVPDAHCRFVQWSDGVLTAARTDANVTANITVTAFFAITYTLTYTAGPNGSITGISPQTVYSGGSGTAVTAVPEVGYMFLQWSDNSTQNPRTDTNVRGNVTVTARFGPAVVSVPAGTFTMGRTSGGDDATYGGSDELPTHSVTLGAYQIEQYLVTNKEYCDVLNWALAQGYLKESSGHPWAGTRDIYAGGNLQIILAFTDSNCNIQYSGGVFSSKTREDREAIRYSMDTHPVEDVSWYGSVAYCNWLSQMEGLLPCYDMTTANWPLAVAPPMPGGYRLPTEAEWERAAAWDGSKHWIYGFTSDTNASNNQSNVIWYNGSRYDYVNPLDLTTMPYTSPVGWFNGTNVSPKGSVTTVNSVSPVGAYDMSGNVWEWCGDWYAAYGSGAQTNPTGPATGSTRVLRGGSWGDNFYISRSAYRDYTLPTYTNRVVGFRLARSVDPVMVSVPAGTFTMGRTASGDDATQGDTSEDPQHQVTLSAYQIGKYEVTNGEYCAVLNWALAQGYLKDSGGNAWARTGEIYAGGNLQVILLLTSSGCNIQYSGGVFSSKTRVGLPGTTNYSMDTHPVECMSWYGSVAYCNWLSQMKGLTPCYDMTTAYWPLVVAPPTPGGYRLPTEAEWERAAAWGRRPGIFPPVYWHWIYGFGSNTNSSNNQCNDAWYNGSTNVAVNPLGLTTEPYTSPVGWFNGTNVSPNGNVQTLNSVSPVGCYDMSGNVWEWCGDWYSSTYYSGGSMTNPTGPASPVYSVARVLRGGSWDGLWMTVRSAYRGADHLETAHFLNGFRLAMSVCTLTYTAGPHGTISDASPQTVAAGGSGTAVTAVPDAGYMFLEWSDGSMQNPRTDTNVTGDVTVTAIFGPLMVSVPPGTFTMGRTSGGDDAAYGGSDEVPRHSVTLGAYQIGKCLVTNRDYCEVLNWALAQGYLKTAAGAPWAGTGDIYAGGNLQIVLTLLDGSNCNIQYSGGAFSSKTRVGLPGTTSYSMDTHPVEDVTWYGSVAYCNWLSQMEGLTPCYDMTTANWPLTVGPPTSFGYRLPTEAEWERAAAWDGSTHWIYGFTSDTLGTATNRCNDYTGSVFVNPLGLTTYPDTSPVGWFNGTNVSPNGSVTTVNSVSPVGAYDMSGNVWEWCGDWYLDTYYSGGSMTNPTGPASGSDRAVRGGSWSHVFGACRSACRNHFPPGITYRYIGFRLARSVGPVMISVPSGTFTMGRTASGDDATYGNVHEDPQHSVTLGAYQIGQYLVTNREYCEVLNWALAQGYLKTAAGATWAGTGDIYAGGNLQRILFMPSYRIQYSGGAFSSKTAVGLPWTTTYSMETHPVEDVSWYGSVAFCNWLSQMEGLTPCYDMNSWSLTVAPPPPGGYRLPTEAEWERAAAWDGSKHWIYGFTSDTNASNNQCNAYTVGDVLVNPLGLTEVPFTSPVGWFNGVNVSPNGSVTTVNSVSPVGCYDMSGNVEEWCGDWYAEYGPGAQTNPTGPGSDTGYGRVCRGSSWDSGFSVCRSAFRDFNQPTEEDHGLGFRLARTP